MATNCEDVSAQMMELLYGELPTDARANVDAHVAGCARCRSELEGFEKTRAAARAGLDEAPPARAHAAIMKAAAAHLAAQAQPVAPRPAVPERASFWDRLRAGWRLPTFATVGAIAVFVIASRVFLSPEHALDSHRAVQNEEAQQPAATPTLPAAPQPVAEPAALAPQGGAPSPSASAARHRAASAAPKPSSRRDISDDPLGGLGFDSPAPAEESRAPRGHAKGKKPALEEPKAEGGEGRFAPAPPAREAAERNKDIPLANQKFAAPPPPREEAAPRYKEAEKPAAKKAPQATVDDLLPSAPPAAKRAAPASTPAKTRAALDDDKNAADKAMAAGVGSSGNVGGSAGPRNKGDGSGYGGGGLAQVAPTTPAPRPTTTATGERSAMKQLAQAPAAAAPPAPSPPPPPPAMQAPTQSKPKAKRSVAALEGDEGSAPEPEARAKSEKKQVAAGKPSAIEVLVQRADRLFDEGQWSEAAAAYRELLRKDPRNGDVKRWRDRVIAADNFDLSQRQATQASRKAAAPRTAADSLESDQQRSSDTKAARARSKGGKASSKASVSDDAAK